ncbi:Ferredoxin-dependent glutamate synthase [hydrothermal vent metagenome]|uniref:Ferredoxin-dependent glutamate synthase n=1 Tax=hydrothermal vent metagenome TaxID=652676 RepID=A0A3B1CC23_9ZZZZ
MIETWSRSLFVIISVILIIIVGAIGAVFPLALWFYAILVPFIILGVIDMFQTRKAVLRNFPALGHFRYLLESVRPEIQQYFIESDSDEHPFSREKRAVVYRRAKKCMDTLPFGTLRDVNRTGYEWIVHSMKPVKPDKCNCGTTIGKGVCKQPYQAALLNISAMSFGALSKNAILALNKGAKRGGFYHNTGEGGISPYHLEGGADLVWQIGTGYFGCRKADGSFCQDTFRERASSLAVVKMIEIKISQGAKPGHGGILPAAKVSKEISEIRGIPMGEDVISPPWHSAFGTPVELMEFVAKLRELSGGKPVGFKICIGNEKEFMSTVKAMLKTGIAPDFITVDGAEGGTGAAPLEFSNSVGSPLNDGLWFVHNTLVAAGVRDRMKIIAAGKITTGFHMISKLALGADLCNAARAMMFALGCIQARQCNTNHCPVGVATQDPKLAWGLDIEDKASRVANFQALTVESAIDLFGAAGLKKPCDLGPTHIRKRTGVGQIRRLDEVYTYLEDGALVHGNVTGRLADMWEEADADHF